MFKRCAVICETIEQFEKYLRDHIHHNYTITYHNLQNLHWPSKKDILVRAETQVDSDGYGEIYFWYSDYIDNKNFYFDKVIFLEKLCLKNK